MSKEAILKIKAAEETAENIRASASAEAKKRIRDTEALGKQLCEETERRVTAENEKKLALIREKADETILKSRETTTDESKQTVGEANLHMREAVRYIIGGIMKECQ